MVRLASGKRAISTAPATPSSSSSASSRLSWQPSQEANLKTAIRGLVPLELMFSQQTSQPLITENRAVLADEVWPILAVAAQTDGTLHVPFHRQVNIAGEHAAVLLEFSNHVAHHDFGTADESHCFIRMHTQVAEQRGHHTDAAAPVHATIIDGGEDLSIRRSPPRCQFLLVEQIAWAAGAIKDDQTDVIIAMAQNMVNRGAQRGQADAACDDQHILPANLFQRPRRAERTAHT